MPLDHAGRGVERVNCVLSDVEVANSFREHVVGEIGDRDLNVAVSDVDADHSSGRILQHELHARPSTTPIGRLGVDLEYEARIL